MAYFNIALVVIASSLVAYFGLPWLYGRFLKLLLEYKAIKAKGLVLTFDDGPGSRLTPQILQILKEHNVKATFFLLGINIPGREHIVRQIKLDGHQIASHSYSHLNHWKISPFKAIGDMRKGCEAIDDALGVQKEKYLFRPPYGKLNIVSLIYLLIKRMPINYWTIVSGDTYRANKRDFQQRAFMLKIKNGGVILAHDFDRDMNNIDEFVIESLEKAIIIAKENNIKIMTFKELYG